MGSALLKSKNVRMKYSLIIWLLFYVADVELCGGDALIFKSFHELYWTPVDEKLDVIQAPYFCMFIA